MAPDNSYKDHRARYATAISNAQSHLEQLLQTDDHSWRPLNNNNSNSSSTTTTTKKGHIEPGLVKLDKRTSLARGAPDVVRATLDVPLVSDTLDRRGLLESFQVALRATEIRPMWDKLVEQATTLEIIDPRTRVYKTDYRLGWPASPRDTVTISKTTMNLEQDDDAEDEDDERRGGGGGNFLIDCATSLPRFADEPSFLRPSPPYVRSHVHLYAWVFEIVPSSLDRDEQEREENDLDETAAGRRRRRRRSDKLRIRLYWSWSLNHRLTPPIVPSSSSPLLNSTATTPPPPSSSSSSTLTTTTTTGGSNQHHPYRQHLPHLLVSLVNHVVESTSSSIATTTTNAPGGSSSIAAVTSRIPILTCWDRETVQPSREDWDSRGFKWQCEWDVVSSPSSSASSSSQSSNGTTEDHKEEEEEEEALIGMEGVTTTETKKKKKRKRKGRLTLQVGLPVPASLTTTVRGVTPRSGGVVGRGRDGWDVRISSKNVAQTNGPSTTSPRGDQDEGERYTVRIETRQEKKKDDDDDDDEDEAMMTRYDLKVLHDDVVDKDGLERFKMSITRLVGGKGVRVNGNLVPVTRPTSNDQQHDEDDEDDDEEEEEEVTRWREILKRSLELEQEPTRLSTDKQLGSSSSGGGGGAASLSFSNHSGISIRSNNSTTTLSQQRQVACSSQISTLLRRSYIYFLSLLQEPPQKWKPITDSSVGVTITQLLSPDPTLTIYRAEAVFVGVGVWDVFASVLSAWGTVAHNKGGGGSWDKGIEQSRLVRQDHARGGADLSEVWWEKRKGNWPVAPRDSVTLRTSYKSPTSIHIFSFSTDDTSLFPSIPPVEPPTIRTQTDLSGWSIESLSPTTTSITLLDQSDPKGWSNKSWTPNQLVQAVAGVRDFTIKYGAPPVVTRLAGAKKNQVGYDHDRGTFRVEYEIDSFSSSGSSSVNSETSSLTDTSTIKSIGGARTPEPIELELRCDISVWSPSGLELMIDPPPSSVSCLSRHRLSSGGGLWLTIEHPVLIVRESGEGRVVVTVKKTSKGQGGGGGGVLINGARVKVDVEVLEDDKVRELEMRKRRKFSPVPLDQYETLGARVWAHQNPPNGASNSSAGADSSKKSTHEKGSGGGGQAELEEGRAGEQREREALHDGDEQRKPPSVASIDSSSIDAAANTPLEATAGTSSSDAKSTPPRPLVAIKPPLAPPAAALEALAYLQSFHAEQGPELTDPAPGWSIVSERSGTVVRKKMIAGISDVIPVYRGDKIVQGLTADEIASVVTSAGCRKQWDERVDQAVPLASYGNGISTFAMSTKPAFPFKGRIFYVSTVTASVKVPSASSTSSTSTVLFVASASFVPPDLPHPGSEAFDAAKVNPNSLLTGQVLLEGWILETLDPYTSSVLAIPSTRLTYLASIDQKGSVPVALNQVLNANLAKSIANVESFGKTRGPIPRVATPSNGVQIEGPLSEDGEGDCVWKLAKTCIKDAGGVGDSSKVVAVNYGDEDKTFKALFKVGGKPQVSTAAVGKEDDAERPPRDNKKRGSSSGAVPTIKSLGVVGSSLLKSELPRSASLNFGVAAPPVLHKSSVTSELSHKRSRGSLRSKSPAAPPVATGGVPQPPPPAAAATLSSSSSTVPASSSSLTTANDPNANDLVVAEFVVDLKQYPHGYSVLASSSLVSPAESTTPQPLSLDSLPPKSLAPSASTIPTVPLRLTAHDAPLPSILTASLDAWKRANHLVRILVPTSAITHPVQDPLRDPSKTRVEKPEWYKVLTEGRGALVEVKIVPLPASPAATNAPPSASSSTERPKLATAAVGNSSEPTGLGKVTGQANKTVMFNGEKVTVMSQKDSRAVLARFEDEDAPLQGAKLSRVARRKRKSSAAPVDLETAPPGSTLPLELQEPLAIATSLLAPVKVSTPINENDDFEFPDPKSPGMMTPAARDSGSPAMSKSGSLQPVSNRRSTTSSESTPLSGPLSAILGSYPLARLGSSIVNATSPSGHHHHHPRHHHHSRDSSSSSTEGQGSAVAQRHYSLGFVISVALISFLLGSFLRSLLTPADYIVYHAAHSGPLVDGGGASTMMSSTVSSSSESVEKALLSAFDPHRHWREAKRLVELRTGIVGWDLIVAAVKRD